MQTNNSDKLQAIIGDYQTFLQKITSEIAVAMFDMDDFVQMDHMCYRVTSFEDYETKKHELSEVADAVGEANINGRPITTFRLHEPVRFDRWRIDAVELPAPKADSPMPEGLDHVELVLYDSMEKFLQKYAHKQFNMAAADRGVNPEISYKLPTYTVKFHLLNLPTVVYLENKLGMTDIHDGQ
jgi:predicted metalloenzyme YecM